IVDKYGARSPHRRCGRELHFLRRADTLAAIPLPWGAFLKANWFGRWVYWWAGDSVARELRTPGPEEAPLRAELFTADQMAQHGKNLAAAHELTSARTPDRLLARLASNEKVLVDVCALLARNAESTRRVTPAGEWLL